jgi:hypothetical protein
MPYPLFDRLSSEHRELLSKLERQRKIVRRKWLAWLLLPLVSVLIGWSLSSFFGMFGGHDQPYAGAGEMIGFLFLIGGALWISLRFPDADDINNAYRKTILPMLVKDTLPAWSSASDHRLTLAELVNTGLYSDRSNQVLKEDFFTGPAGTRTAKIYEVLVRSNTLRKVRMPKGGSFYERHITNLFYGYFYFLSPFPVFSSRCWIFSRTKKNGWMDDWIDVSVKNASQLHATIQTGDPVFDAMFIVFCEDATATRVRLDANTRRKLISAAELVPGACGFSFTGTRLYVMNSFPDDPLNAVTKKSIVKEMEAIHRKELDNMRCFVELLGK